MEKRLLITLRGCVQGVGFRPFVFRLAHRHHLKGYVCNTSYGVYIDIQGNEEALTLFQRELDMDKPRGACISEIKLASAELCEYSHFEISGSRT